MESKWKKLPPPYENVEAIPGRFKLWNEISLPGTFKVKHRTTGKVHEVERVIIFTSWHWKGNATFYFKCCAEVNIDNYVLTEEPLTCKYCANGGRKNYAK